MRKHTKAGLVLLMAGMMMAGSVTSAFADTEATAATSGVIDTTKKNAETGGPGSTAASTENTLDGHTYSTKAPGSNTSQTQASTSAPETSASAESSQDVTSGQDNALTQDQANQLESEQAAAEAEAAEANVIRDANGNILADGDTVTVIKDLKVKGAPKDIKQGIRIKNIRLVEGDHNIDCKIEGFGSMKLKSEFVKKI